MIYDCFMYNGEEEMLEIRLNLLDKHVDYFVLCESTETFSGKPKPAFYADNPKRFKKWEDKIIYQFVRPENFSDSFKRAAYQKNSIQLALQYCHPDDIIYYGDVDEIWKPQKKEGKLRQLAYSYYLNNRSSEDWQGTNMFKYKHNRDLNEIRADHSVILEDGGWHFTNCFSLEEIVRKIESYDHQEVNIPWVKDGLKARIDANIDFLGRTHDWKGNEFKLWKDESDLPKYILDNKDKYKHIWRS